jgi:putative sterol carrier protein
MEITMSDITVEKLMSRMPKAFLPDKAVGVDAVIQYHLSGEEAGDWIIRIQDGTCTVEPGVAENPKMTLSADSEDYKNVILGKINGMNAFMEGKLRLAGDLNLAMKLTSFFKLN